MEGEAKGLSATGKYPMTPFEVFIQQVINGFTTGSYLALIALGYTMVYGLIELINFAHGDVYAWAFSSRSPCSPGLVCRRPCLSLCR